MRTEPDATDPVDILRRNAIDHPDRDAVICAGRRQSHGELYDRAARFANALRALGIAPGERVAVLADNMLETTEQLAGLALGGYVRAALYTHDTPERHRYLLGLVDAAALIVQDKYLDHLADVAAQCPSIRATIVIGAPDRRYLSYAELLTSASSEPLITALDPDAPHLIRFSAGTTGLPKGILHTLRGWMAVGQETVVVLKPSLTSADRYLAAGPLTHATSMPLWPVLAAGAAVVVMPTFDAEEFLRLVESEHITISLLVATMVQLITRHPDAQTRDLSSLRAIFYGASPIPESTLIDGLELWGNVMYQSYGQSEAAPVTALLPEHHVVNGTPEERERLRSAGRATPNSGVRILDENDRQLPPGEIGEIVVTTPGRMREIWRDAEATAQRITHDGWVRTRDMGWMDTDGFLFLADRKEDLIISGGFNIWPAELENVLTAHPAVREAVIVGVPHPKWGETPLAEIVIDGRYDGEVTEQSIIDWTREHLGPVKKVTHVRFVSELPRTPVGKVLRRVVRERHQADPQRTGQPAPRPSRSGFPRPTPH